MTEGTLVSMDADDIVVLDGPDVEEAVESKVPSARFFVTDGTSTVGPVDGDLLARGLMAGRVPLDALVWCAGWEKWRVAREYATQAGALPTSGAAESKAKLARVSDLLPMQMAATHEQQESLSRAASLEEGAKLAFSLSASLTGAECGWIHVMALEAGGGMVALEGIGPRAGFGVGRTIAASDHALRVAKLGRTVLGEPIPGVVGSAVAARLMATGKAPTSVMMVPIICTGRLAGMIELGVESRESGFTVREAAVVEQIAVDLGNLMETRGWLKGERLGAGEKKGRS